VFAVIPSVTAKLRNVRPETAVRILAEMASLYITTFKKVKRLRAGLEAAKRAREAQ
jgi:hypothetical protein